MNLLSIHLVYTCLAVFLIQKKLDQYVQNMI